MREVRDGDWIVQEEGDQPETIDRVFRHGQEVCVLLACSEGEIPTALDNAAVDAAFDGRWRHEFADMKAAQAEIERLEAALRDAVAAFKDATRLRSEIQQARIAEQDEAQGRCGSTDLRPWSCDCSFGCASCRIDRECADCGCAIDSSRPHGTRDEQKQYVAWRAAKATHRSGILARLVRAVRRPR